MTRDCHRSALRHDEGRTDGTSSPIYINAGLRSAWLHRGVSRKPIEQGDLAVVDLTPQFAGYCANLARTFVVGEAGGQEQLLLDTYLAMRENTRHLLRPGVTVAELDAAGADTCASRSLAQYHINGRSHSIGLRFEENPASTIIPTHRRTKLRAEMTVTVGHIVLAIPEAGGVRCEDVYRVTDDGGAILHDYPMEPRIN
ncbi:MAG: M24 family metallopeptidase [Bryobacterales bacterium]|nr:M24 family metallopeptidase [Bryobacterales bacterium]